MRNNPVTVGNNPAIFKAKALAISALLDGQLLASEFSFRGSPLRRELEIQIAKGDRMLDAFVKKFGWEARAKMALKTSAQRKAFRRKVGPEIAKLDRQANKMQELFYKTLEEAYFHMQRPITRKQFRHTMTTVHRNFEKVVYAGVQQVQRELSGASGQKRLKS
jgi:hypothetical protein